MVVIAYALAGLWFLGCTVLPLYAAVSLFQDRDTGLGAAVLLIGFPLGCLIAVLPVALIEESQSPDLATLKKNEWVCSASHSVSTTTYVKSGSVMVPVTSRHQECDVYSKAILSHTS